MFDRGMGASPAPPDRQRAHWRKWLSVHLPEGQAKEDKPVLFRFYDTAILAAFLGTLGPEDAAAFFGPIETIVTIEPAGARAFTLTPAARLATPRPFPPGGLYRIEEAQYAILANVTADAFRADLFHYLRSEFAPETRDMTDAEVRGLIDAAMADAARTGDKRQGALLSLVVIRLLRPDLLENKFVMNQVMEAHPLADDPKQRVGILQGYIIVDFEDLERHDAYFARLARFWQGDF